MGYRMTPQRQIILDAVCESNGHVSVGELYDRVASKAPAINRATVYRTLNFLHDLGLVNTAEINGRVVYEIADPEPHHHLHCRHCGRVEVLGDAHFRTLVAHIAAEHHFYPEIEHLTLNGVCADCVDEAAPRPLREDVGHDSGAGSAPGPLREDSGLGRRAGSAPPGEDVGANGRA